MLKVNAVNCDGYLRIEKVAGGDVQIQAVFPNDYKSPVAKVGSNSLYSTISSRKEIHDFVGNLRRVVNDKPNTLFRSDSVYAKRATVRMFFASSPSSPDLMVVKKVDLKKALLLTFRW